MKAFILASLLVIVVGASIIKEVEVEFQTFKLHYNKKYQNSLDENIRYAVFRENYGTIREHNVLYEQGFVSYKQEVNQFADMTVEEYKAFLSLHDRPTYNGTEYVITGVVVPSYLDWRTLGQVTEVKNQGDCGSCWAFSLTGTVEAAYYRKQGDLISLSEQQLVDCATKVNYGCSGGYMAETFPYIEKYGLESESSYPYKGRNGKCHYDSSKVVTKVDNYVHFEKNEHSLLEAVATVGPISVAMDAFYLAFYSSGIFSSKDCTTMLNHGVLIVGYGTESGKDYWIVKNSWGTGWGEEGYFRILRGANECGIAEDNVYPIIN